MEAKQSRSIKIYEQSGYQYKPTPTIILKGQWLRELGFEIGEYISVSCENGRLIITPDEERATLEKAKAEYMEKETQTLQKKFEKEKRWLQAQFVAEKAEIYRNSQSVGESAQE